MSTAISRAYFAADANGHYRPYYAAASDYREAIDATKADDVWYEDGFAVDQPTAEPREPVAGPGNVTHSDRALPTSACRSSSGAGC